MAVEKINYENKLEFQNDPNVPNKNKVTDENVNEIKTVVNTNADELDTAKQNIENLQSGEETLNTDITNLKNRVTTLESDNTTNKSNISNLQNNKVNKIEGKGLSTNDFTDELKTKLENLNNYNDTEVKNDISELQTDMTSVENSISTINTNIANKVDKVEGKGLSTEDFTTALKTKLEGLSNYDDTEIQQDIQDIQEKDLEQDEKLETQNDLIERLKDNQINITTEQSSTINVQDCSNLSAKIDVFGVSSQETRSGKNLLDISLLAKELTNGISYTYGNDKIHVEGTATALAPSNVANVTNKLEIGKKYILSLNKSNNDNVIATASIQYNDGTPQAWVSSFMFAENMQAVNIYLQVSSGTTVNVDITAQLEEGEVATEYEKYGASPSPEYPSEIENVVGDIDITVSNKNLFDGIFEEGTIDAEGNLVTTSNVIRTKNFIKANGLISISYENALDIAVYAYDINKNFIAVVDKQTTTSLGLEKASSYNLPQTTKYIKFRFNSGYINLTTKAQVEKSNIATDYIEHEQQTITFPLEEGQKLYKGDYLASDGIHHKRKQIAFDGTENWALYAGYANNAEKGYCYYLNIVDCKIVKDTSISTHFKNVFGAYQESVGYIGAFSDNLSVKNKYFISDKENLEKFKAYLAEQKTAGTPVKLEYELETEEIEAFTEEQQAAYDQLQNAKTYKTVTNVFTDNAEVEMNYIADTKTYVDNEINSIKEQLNTINELLSTTTTTAMLLDNLQTDLESEVL